MQGDLTAAPAEPCAAGKAYAQGMAHLQAGRWKEAIACLDSALRDAPGDPMLQRALDEAHFKADLDKKARVRAKRWNLPGRAFFFRLLLLALVVAAGVYAYRIVSERVTPLLAEYRAQQRLKSLIRDGGKLLEGGNLDAAQVAYEQALAADPGNEAAIAGLDSVAFERRITGLYAQGVDLQEKGDCSGALEAFTGVLLLRTPYIDVSQRIERCQKQQTLAELFLGAEADAEAGRWADALGKYGQLQVLDLNYQREQVLQRIYELNMALGRQLIEEDPPSGEAVAAAWGHFRAALQVMPRDPDATTEQALAQGFLDGQARYDAADWLGAISAWQPVLVQRPGYLRGLVASSLYQAYLRRGDQLRDAGDCNAAYGFYQAASQMPLPNVAVSLASMSKIRFCLTPTPTPSPTPTPVPTATQTPTPEPTKTRRPTPTPTPWNLGSLHNRILFKAYDGPGYLQGEPDLWVMNPDGTGRRKLGPFAYYESQYQSLYERHARSPDNEYVLSVNRNAQIVITRPSVPSWGPLQLTHMTGIAYDPQWSPDGGRVVFVSHENGGADIWVMGTDGANQTCLTRNTWEWEKHPSWSPNSQQVAFWSNRNGLAQIYVTTPIEGREQRNISQSQLNEWDPIWVR
ncbi:MAG TPA: hypothetical protein PKO09_09085 [Anaerolineae bacterium]|nr:hypothetical protein [Anaerolineae bacterium]